VADGEARGGAFPGRLLPAPLRALARRLLGRPPTAPVLAVVIPVDAPLAAAVRALQDEVERDAAVRCDRRTPPHVTLKLGFAAPAPEAVEAWLEALGAAEAPLALGVGGIGAFDEGILFLDVERSPALEALRRRVVSGLAARLGVAPWPLEQGEAFHFHVTLATGLAPEALAAARRRLGEGPARRVVEASQLALLEAEGDGWTVRRAVRFGAGPG